MSAENIRRKVKDSIEGGEELNKMGRTVTDSFIKSNSATNQKIYSNVWLCFYSVIFKGYYNLKYLIYFVLH